MTAPATNPGNTLPSALLLAATGGLLDAVIYLIHGNVFANAMTGNVVLLGIAALSHDRSQILPHCAPLAGFLLGVTTSKSMRSRLDDSHLLLLGLTFESVALLIIGLLPHTLHDTLFTATVAFVAAFQAASFRRVETFSYNSTFLTGNLRATAEGLYDAVLSTSQSPEIRATRKKGISQALDLGSICLCFLLGACLGAWAAPRFGNRSLWLAEPFLLATLLHALHYSSSHDPHPGH